MRLEKGDPDLWRVGTGLQTYLWNSTLLTNEILGSNRKRKLRGKRFFFFCLKKISFCIRIWSLGTLFSVSIFHAIPLWQLDSLLSLPFFPIFSRTKFHQQASFLINWTWKRNNPVFLSGLLSFLLREKWALSLFHSRASPLQPVFNW